MGRCTANILQLIYSLTKHKLISNETGTKRRKRNKFYFYFLFLYFLDIFNHQQTEQLCLGTYLLTYQTYKKP